MKTISLNHKEQNILFQILEQSRKVYKKKLESWPLDENHKAILESKISVCESTINKMNKL